MSKECFNGDGLHPKKSPKKDFIESKRKEFNKKIHIYKAAHKSETAKIDDWWNEEYGMSYYYEPHKEVEEFLTSSLNEAWDKGEEQIKITNKIKCASFSEEPDFRCKKVLPIEEMRATVKEPNTFYCNECYQRGLDMEYEAMGLR